jgi:hypothetical protein
MSKQKLVTRSAGFLRTNAGRIGQSLSKPSIKPQDEPHANGCGCLTCHITGRVDEALDRELGGEPDLVGNALPPSAGVLTNNGNRVTANGPLLLPRGVLAGGDA